MTTGAQTELWLELPESLRRPVLSGIRWTIWLSLAAVPFSFGTRLLLARLGPHVLAVYGLLLVYINFVSAFFLIGGNAVIIRFLPSVTARLRRPFLRGYAAVIAAWLALWLVPVIFAPGWLRPLLGPLATPRLCRLALLLAPLGILFSLALAALKALMEIDRAQLLYRLVTVGTFCAYATLALVARASLLRHPAAWIGGAYLGFAGLAGALALLRLRTRLPAAPQPRWYLPRSFWSYTLSLEGSSMLGFFAAELDTLLVLHRGGLHVLGEYVAVMTLALAVTPLLKLLLDTLMASLTNALALGEPRAGGSLVATYARLLLPAILLFGAGLAALAPLWLHIFGAAYAGLSQPLILAACGAAFYGLNCLAGTLLSSLGYPQAEVIAKLVAIGSFLALFFPLWHWAGLLGAVLAWSLAEFVYLACNVLALLRRAPFPMPWLPRSAFAFFLALLLAAAVSLLLPAGAWLLRLSCWFAPVAAFFLLARYSRREVQQLLGVLMPSMLRSE